MVTHCRSCPAPSRACIDGGVGGRCGRQYTRLDIAAPRLPTVGRNTSLFHTWSLIMSRLTHRRWWQSVAYMVGEWLPHTASFLKLANG
jgi:hypothetical protein